MEVQRAVRVGRNFVCRRHWAAGSSFALAAIAGLTAMIAGHFGLSAIVKSRAPYVPLWALMVATVWLDVVFVPLFLSGVETIESTAGPRGGYGTGIIHADYTHSLVGALTLSALFGYLAYWLWGRRCFRRALA